jgi:hypothetical protein
MPETRDFHIGDVLSITTGMLVSPSHMRGIYQILNWMTGDNLYTHQLPRAADECQKPLLEQHPDLADVQLPDEFNGEEHVRAWLAEQVEHFGETRSVAPLDPGDHTHINPFVELQMMAPHVPIIGVEIDDRQV